MGPVCTILLFSSQLVPHPAPLMTLKGSPLVQRADSGELPAADQAIRSRPAWLPSLCRAEGNCQTQFAVIKCRTSKSEAA